MIMILHRLQRLPIISLLALCLLTSPMSASGYVWCLSADGHAEMEAALAGDCGLDTSTPTPDGLLLSALTAGSDDCGPCLDISSSHQWGSPRSRHEDLPVSLLADFVPAIVMASVPLPERTLNPCRIVDTSPRISEPILHHRTIVLLI